MANFSIRGYDHVKVGLKDIPSFEKALDAFGFQPITQPPPDYLKKPTSIWGSGEAFFCLYDASHPLAKTSHAAHGDWIFDLSYWVEAGSPTFFEIDEGVEGLQHTLVSNYSV